MERMLLRIREVEKRCGYKRAWIYSLMAQGRFPKQVRLGNRSVAWRSDDIQNWINSRPRI